MKKAYKVTILLLTLFLGLGVFSFKSINYSEVDAVSNEKDDIASFLEFEKEIINLNKQNDLSSFEVEDETNEIGIETNENDYSLKRLIVQGNVSNTYGANKKVSYNNLHVLCYDSELETKQAYEALSKNSNLDVSIDEIVELEQYAEKEYSYTSNINWGAKAADIGGYREYLSDNNVNTEGVVVILDTGINTSHTMFNNRLLKNTAGKIKGFSYFDSDYQYSYDNLAFDEDDTNKHSFEDDIGHGTHVAGIVASLTPSNVKILPIKIGMPGKGSSNSSTMISAFLRVLNIYSKQYNILSVNMSYSGGGKDNESSRDTFNSQCYTPLKEKNILCSLSAGNDAEEKYVEGLDAVVVSSLKQVGNQFVYDHSYSNYGAAVDIAAPGTAIRSAYISSTDSANSTILESLNGTSMASPQVAGIIALLALDPQLQGYTGVSLEEKLYEYSLDLGAPGKDAYYGHGMVSVKYFEPERHDEVTLSFYADGVLIEDYEEYRKYEDNLSLEIICSDSDYQIIYTSNKQIPSYLNSTTYESCFDVENIAYYYCLGVKIVNNEIVERTTLYNISFFNKNTPVEDCFTIDSSGRITSYIGRFRTLVVPEKIKGITPIGFAPSIFENTELESVTMPNSIITLSGYLFQGCKNLKYVYAPNVTKVYIAVFNECVSIKNVYDFHPEEGETEGIYLPNLVETIGFSFNKCSNLQTVSLSKVTQLGLEDEGADFQLCTSLKSVYIPNIKSIPRYTFNQCNSLTSEFIIGDYIESIGEFAFNSCAISKFIVSNSNTNFYTDGLGLYSNSAIVAFAAGNKNIDYEIKSSVFINGQYQTISAIVPTAISATSLNTVTIPSTINLIDKLAFYNTSIHTLKFNAKNCTDTGYYEDDGKYVIFKEIETVEIGESVQSVPKYLFYSEDVKNFIINSENTTLNTKCLYVDSLNKLTLNFTDTVDSAYVSRLSSAGLYYRKPKILMSKSPVAVNSYSIFNHLDYEAHDGTYYVYSEEPYIKTYTITASSNELGSISPSGVTELVEGDTITYTFTPNEGCYVESISVNGVHLNNEELEQAISNGYTFENITQYHTISVVFDICKYTIEVIQADNGVISNADASYIYGSNATFTITANQGYEIEEVFIDGESVGKVSSYRFENIKQNHTISAMFIESSNTSYTANHWLESLSSVGSVLIGDKYYVLDKQDTSLVGTTNALTNAVADNYLGYEAQPITQQIIKADGTTEVDILYNRKSFSVNLVKSVGVETVVGGGDYIYGEEVVIYATLSEGYVWSSWLSSNPSVVASSTSQQYNFTMPNSDIMFSAQANIMQFEINVTDCQNGTVYPDENVLIDYGNNQTIQFIPNTGYEIEEVFVDGESVGKVSSYRFENVKQNHEIRVVFVKQKVPVFVIVGDNGSSNISGETFVLYGETLLLNFTPNVGYQVKEVKVNNMPVGSPNSYELTNVIESQTISVEFEKLTLIVNVVAGENGTLNPSGEVNVKYGDNLTIEATPNVGYGVSEIKLDGENLKITNEIEIKNITKNCTLEVSFAKSFYITSISGTNGSITDSAEVPYGEQKRFDFYPDAGYRVKDVKIDGISIGNVDYYVFVNVAKAHTIAVEFEHQPIIVNLFIDGEGSIQKSKELESIVYGDDLTITLKPQGGWQVYKVYVNGENRALKNNQLILQNLQEDINIQIVFNEKIVEDNNNYISVITIILGVVLIVSVSAIALLIIKYLKIKKRVLVNSANQTFTFDGIKQQAINQDRIENKYQKPVVNRVENGNVVKPISNEQTYVQNRPTNIQYQQQRTQSSMPSFNGQNMQARPNSSMIQQPIQATYGQNTNTAQRPMQGANNQMNYGTAQRPIQPRPLNPIRQNSANNVNRVNPSNQNAMRPNNSNMVKPLNANNTRPVAQKPRPINPNMPRPNPNMVRSNPNMNRTNPNMARPINSNMYNQNVRPRPSSPANPNNNMGNNNRDNRG